MDNKILILEDEKELGVIYLKILKDKGYDPVLSGNGIEGLEKLKTFQPSLILLDLGMPKMNGIEFYQHICDSKGKPRYPILVLTGRTDLKTLFNDLVVEGFIIKPFKKEQLLTDVDIIMKREIRTKEAGSKRIMIVDENAVKAPKIKEEFAKAGYKSEIINNGLTAVELIMSDPPDIAAININLSDIPGDLLIVRLKEMTKTKGVKFVLYIEGKQNLDKKVMDNMSQKSGVKILCAYEEPKEIVEAIEKIFQESKLQE